MYFDDINRKFWGYNTNLVYKQYVKMKYSQWYKTNAFKLHKRGYVELEITDFIHDFLQWFIPIITVKDSTKIILILQAFKSEMEDGIFDSPTP